jgi:glucokinase
MPDGACPLVLGVDIGGTKIAAGVVDASARVLRSVVRPTRAAEGCEVSLAQVLATIAEAFTPEIAAIGICAPGPLNPKTGVVLNPPNLHGWRNVPLAEIVSGRFGVPCRVENDANAAGLAETLFGAARGCASVLYMTWSTGIGAGIVLDGKIYYGKNGAAAEGGHVTVDYRSETVCNCGSRGCIEALASGTAMANRARTLLPAYPGTSLAEPVTGESLGVAAAAGDELALRVLDESATMVAAWMGSMISLLDPDIIVVGGGISRIGEPLFARLRREVPARTINQFADQVPIVPAQLAGEVGILGAASVVLAPRGLKPTPHLE